MKERRRQLLFAFTTALLTSGAAAFGPTPTRDVLKNTNSRIIRPTMLNHNNNLNRSFRSSPIAAAATNQLSTKKPQHATELRMSSEPVDKVQKNPQQQQQQTTALEGQSNNTMEPTLDLQRATTSGDGAVAVVADQTERTKNIDDIFYLNGAIVGFIVISALYQLTHTHVEALLALWEYGLGPHPPDMTKVSVAMDLLTRLPFDLVHAYEEIVPTNPIFCKACTSGVAYGLGDFISQIYQGKTLSTLDLPRSFRSGAAGFIVHGPLCHYWLTFMETYLDFNGAWWATGIKVTADLTVWSIFLNASYSFVIGTLAGRRPKEVFSDVRATQWPALRSAWRFWPFVHTVSFSHAVPIDLKLLWVDVMEVIWVTILSKVANEDKIARQKEAENVETAVVAVNVDELVPEVDPALEIELTREIELDSAPGGASADDLSFELPKRVLGACWPLIAMWPVLYAGYQIESALGIL
mmetsp:Transcript_2372/g.5049  ORF Transcript_2372/g.5049 Transcript_2372/m.5049 type:complete len:467 (-) Transcript_2372:225-1625(-)|eukprot:CAMPEP_0178636578 /NCGR_PEP_ID=MMETSP0698-20121128/13819_1 /TAXON_ID=265572 /ORGANISM="Extubocellulus spinifer, Strain CCMP396" /LENGTH=466 /DNA_ID=CAMNT_0020276483 /DNA_START=168 /DNA_END=1568 /DNA_ORIENTATION=-